MLNIALTTPYDKLDILLQGDLDFLLALNKLL